MGSLVKSFSSLSITCNLLKPRITVQKLPTRTKFVHATPKKRVPPWLPKQHRVLTNEELTTENKNFIQEVIESKYGPKDLVSGSTSPLKVEPIEPGTEWSFQSQRTGVIARKIGIYPMWLKNGKQVTATLLHVVDNHVVKYTPPEEWKPMYKRNPNPPKKPRGCIVVGADSSDPQLFTKEYCGLFLESGVMPKKYLARFAVTEDAALQPGTPLFAAHYKPGDYIDIRGKTIDRGFQGVMKRWGFKGMPATHGVTKTHRRPGNIGSGGTKARVMPGQKLPGHMGNRYRIMKAQKILRVNTKYNVIWVQGVSTPGGVNDFVTIYDTLIPDKKYDKNRKAPPFPTFFPKDDEPVPEDLFLEEVHQFGSPSIELEPEKEKTKKK